MIYFKRILYVLIHIIMDSFWYVLLLFSIPFILIRFLSTPFIFIIKGNINCRKIDNIILFFFRWPVDASFKIEKKLFGHILDD